MSAATKSDDPDYQLNTLTDMIGIVGETRSDVKVIDRKVDLVDRKVDLVDSRVDQHHKEFSEFRREARERFDKIEDTLAIIVNHLGK